jgi:MFS family permease
MYPVPGGDAAVFMPAAVNLKTGRGLTNSLWAVHSDPTGQHRYLEHLLLFPMVVSACMWRPETKNAFIVLAIFNALTLTFYAAFLCTAKFARNLIASTAGFILSIFSIFALAFLIFTHAGGRPEALSTLILSLAIAVAGCLPQKHWPVCLGIAIGVAAATHPTHGLFIACLVLMVFLLTATVTQTLRKMMLAAAIALSLFWILLSLSPYSIGETLHAVSEHAVFANAPDYRLSTLAVYYLKLAPWSGLYLFGLSLVLVWCGIYLWRNPEDRMTRSARLAALLLTAFAFWFFSIRRPSASYYLIMLAPALAAGALYLFNVRNEIRDRRLATVPFWILVAFFSIFSLCLARDIALFINYRTDGVSFADAQKEFDRLVRSTDQIISVSESFWVLTDEFERIRIVERGTASGDIMVVQQTQRGSLFPPIIPGYRLLSQRFISHPPTCFGWPIARTMPGYAFAVFARETSS